MLTYTTTTTRQITEKHQLTVPKDWSMFTNKGNKRLTKIAQDAYDAIDKLETATYESVNPILIKFLTKYCRMSYVASYEEASDTAVRECVDYFHDKLYEAALGRQWDGDPWIDNYNTAQTKVTNERMKK